MVPEVFRGLPNDLGLRYLWPLLSQLGVTQHWAQTLPLSGRQGTYGGAAECLWRPIHPGAG